MPKNPLITSETDHVRRLKRLLETSRLLHSTLELPELTKIVLRIVRDIVTVDRCTLFVVDHKEKLLRSFIAQGVDEFEIRLPIGYGLAGTVAGTGMPLDVTDVHKDRRFQADFDERLAYTTKDVFCLPIFNREGIIIGVLELLNRAKPLLAEDKEFLSDMCSYLGVALNNAWIHRELVQTRDRRRPA